jgi:xanthine dehydrogenase large subunit
VDIGQIEGGLVQGLGWMTMEEIVYNDKGKLLSNALSTYKVPDIHSVPKEIDDRSGRFRPTAHPLAIRRSKAVTGEPPLMYGIGLSVYFAIQNAAMLQVRPFCSGRSAGRMVFDAPYTPEKVLMLEIVWCNLRSDTSLFTTSTSYPRQCLICAISREGKSILYSTCFYSGSFR